MIDVCILCGGLGTRFQQVSQTTPKILAKLGKQRLIDLILKKLEKHNLHRVILATGHLSNQVKNYVEKCKNFEIIISEEEKQSGTGGALKIANQYLKSEVTLVLNGDTIIDFDIENMLILHKAKKADCSILTTSMPNASEYGTIIVNKDNRIINFEEKNSSAKSNKVNAGVYLINKNIVEYLKVPSSLENDLFPLIAKKKNLFAINTSKRFDDIGTFERYNFATDCYK